MLHLCPSCGASITVAPRGPLVDCPTCRTVPGPDGATRITLLPGTRDAPLPPVAELRLSDEFLSRYRLEEILGSGACGVVYAARQLSMDRDVAVKFLLHRPGPGIVTRFVREGRSLARVAHPHVLQVFDIGEADGCPYLVTELLPGPTLEVHLGQCGRLPLDQALTIARDLLAALGACHARGVTHRDVKPANLMFGPDGRIRLVDLGLARFVEDTARLTRTGALLGTPRYMSPEQARGEEVGPAADLYSAACVVYQMITGEPPYRATSVAGMLESHIRAPVPDPAASVPSLPPGIGRAIRRAMEKEASARPETAAAFADALVAPGATVAGGTVARGRPSRPNRQRPSSGGIGRLQQTGAPPASRAGRRWVAASLGAMLACGLAVTGWRHWQASGPDGTGSVRPGVATIGSRTGATGSGPADSKGDAVAVRAQAVRCLEATRLEFNRLSARWRSSILAVGSRPELGPGLAGEETELVQLIDVYRASIPLVPCGPRVDPVVLDELVEREDLVMDALDQFMRHASGRGLDLSQGDRPLRQALSRWRRDLHDAPDGTWPRILARAQRELLVEWLATGQPIGAAVRERSAIRVLELALGQPDGHARDAIELDASIRLGHRALLRAHALYRESPPGSDTAECRAHIARLRQVLVSELVPRLLSLSTVADRWELLFHDCARVACDSTSTRRQQLDAYEAAVAIVRRSLDTKGRPLSSQDLVTSGITNLRAAARRLRVELDESLLGRLTSAARTARSAPGR